MTGVASSPEVKRRRSALALIAIGQLLSLSPPMPRTRESVPMGAVIKAVARYDRPFWRTDGLSGSAVSMEDPVSVVFDNSPPDGSVGMLVGFFEGLNARTATAMSTSEREGVLIGCLTKLFGLPTGSYRHWAEGPSSNGRKNVGRANVQ